VDPIESHTNVSDDGLARLLEVVFAIYHYDFRQYALASLKRRVQQAMVRLGFKEIEDLTRAVSTDNEAFGSLLRYLTVQVSDMFRDPTYWRMFRTEIVPTLATYPSLKIWVAGCSSGEEVHSFAITLHEEGLLERTTIYATDIDAEALQRAEAGVYAIDRVATFTTSHRESGAKCSLSDYYTTAYDSAIFDKQLRKNVVFADHSLATDSVFGEMHVVSCRNVLIYFNHELQHRALGLFDNALIRRGFLGLGSHESLRFSPLSRTYVDLPASARWYRKL
jgi:chemotaxis protein methyltransferase CheR